ncbi:hypothetical protein GH714_018425 [Hevea brasiliensis]|uniref:Uncharacterized protein n=1 Tax=Hevea brasiliensis TaxID=3981 RepID=A0A6A6MNF4_HEVBR|nr:hypothetical protein GH714_018425 [Hevea brasiliensis]
MFNNLKRSSPRKFHSGGTIRKSIMDSPNFAARLWMKALKGKCGLWAKDSIPEVDVLIVGRGIAAHVWASIALIAQVFPSLQLKEIKFAELNNMLRLLTLCMFFSTKPFPVFLESAGYCLDDVLLQKPKAGIVGHSLGGAIAKARVAGAGALLCPVSRSTQHTLKLMLCQKLLWYLKVLKLLSLKFKQKESVQNKLGCNSSSESGHDDTEEDGPLIPNDRVMNSSAIEDVTEGELWYELEKELQRHESEVDIDARAEEAAVAKENTVEENIITNAFETKSPIISADVSDSNQLESCILFPCLLPILLI